MARCPDCNKFVGIEMADPEPELELELGEGEVTGTVRLVKQCTECGTELEEANCNVEIPFEFGHAKEGCTGELELDNENAESDERSEGKGRGERRFYVANISAEVHCPMCDARVPVEGSVEEQASNFESLS